SSGDTQLPLSYQLVAPGGAVINRFPLSPTIHSRFGSVEEEIFGFSRTVSTMSNLNSWPFVRNWCTLAHPSNCASSLRSDVPSTDKVDNRVFPFVAVSEMISVRLFGTNWQYSFTPAICLQSIA